MILAFKLDWFTTIPGLLVSVGVVLLLIAIILFIVGNRKAKKNAKKMETSSENTAPMVSEATTIPVEPVQPAQVMQPEPVVTTETIVSPIAPIENATTNTATATIEPVAIETTATTKEPIAVQTPATTEPVNTQATETKEPQIVSTETITNQTVATTNGLETPEATNLDKTMISVYGGENPVPTVQPTVEEKTIYGGNNPLDATQNIPVVEETHQPYGGVVPTIPATQAQESTSTQTSTQGVEHPQTATTATEPPKEPPITNTTEEI